MKNFAVFLIFAASLNFICGMNWASSPESGRKKAEAQESPLLLYFYAEEHPKSAEFQLIINSGLLDFLDDNFVLANIDVTDENNEYLILKYNITSIPVFVLDDFNRDRKQKMQPMGIEPVNLFNGLYEIYNNTANSFISIKEFDTAYGCLKVIENLPENFGIEVKKSLKLLEPVIKKNKKTPKKSDNSELAESYMITAENNVKNENYEKAYVYFKKVIELVPDTELARKAKKEQDKIKDLVDKSAILK